MKAFCHTDRALFLTPDDSRLSYWPCPLTDTWWQPSVILTVPYSWHMTAVCHTNRALLNMMTAVCHTNHALLLTHDSLLSYWPCPVSDTWWKPSVILTVPCFWHLMTAVCHTDRALLLTHSDLHTFNVSISRLTQFLKIGKWKFEM
jgi:hypothetical protein